MPHRILNLSDLWIMSFVTSGGAIIAAQGGDPGIMSDIQLRAWVIVGAVMGAAVSILFTPPANVRVGIFKWLGSVLTSFMATPAVYLWFDLDRNIDTVLPVSGTAAFMAWLILRTVQDFTRRKLQKISKSCEVDCSGKS